jgi:hypothetical protein
MRLLVPALRLALAPRLLVAALLLLAAPARAEDAVPDADRGAIRAVIERQIAAFARDDAAGAFAFASPSIQQQFGSPETFLRMVQAGYPAVYRPRSVSFGETRHFDDAIVQQVDVIGPDGTGAHAFYVMEHETDGSWRINGVTMTQGTDKEI